MPLKRLFVAMLVVVLASVAITPTLAQDGTALDATYEDANGAFSFNYPSSWVTYTSNSFDVSYAGLNILVRDDLGYSLTMSGLDYDSTFVARGFDLQADAELTDLVPYLLERSGTSVNEGVSDPVEMMVGDYPFMEVIVTLLTQDGFTYYRAVGIVDLNNGYYAYTQANYSESDADVDLAEFERRHAVGREIVGSFAFADGAIPEAVPFVFDPDAPGNTDVTPADSLVQTINGSEEGAPSFMAPAGFEATSYSTDFSVYFAGYSDIYALIITADELSEFDVSFADARDALLQDFSDDLQGSYPPFASFTFHTGVNSFTFDNGTYADVIYQVTIGDAESSRYSIDGYFVGNDGTLIILQTYIDSEDAADIEAVYAIAADIRGLVSTINFAAGPPVAVVVSDLSTEPDAIADTTYLTQSFSGELGGAVFSFMYPAGWSVDGYESEISLYSNADQFGANEDSLEVLIIDFSDVGPQIGVADDMTLVESAEAVRSFLPTLSDSEVTYDILSEVQVFEFDNVEFAQFSYGYNDDEYYYVAAFGIVMGPDGLFAIDTSLRTVIGPDDLPAFNQANSLVRAIVSTMTISE